MSEIFDVVVAGGGIIGAAAGQQLAAAGYHTLLAERADYGSGTSSRTSRLQHCGLGYFSPAGNSFAAFAARPKFALKCMELARRAMRGRNEFVKSSPERVRKVAFFVPLYDENSISVWKARLAFRVMDMFDAGDLPLEVEILEPAEARRLPLIGGLRNPDRLRAVVKFSEYQFVWPERIVVDTIMKARDIGLEAHNYTGVAAIDRSGEGWGVTLALPDGGTRLIRTKAIVNAAGVWVDDVTQLARPDAPVLNVGAKGTNIVVRLSAEYRGYGMETIMRDGEPFYVIPWGDLHYIGPKDNSSKGTPEGFRAAGSEIDYILNETNAVFPSLGLTRADVLYSWAGVRPRTAAEGMVLGSMDVREHDLSGRGFPNFFVYTGGLLMTHRHAGRMLTEAVQRRVNPSGPQRAIDYGARLVPSGDSVNPESVAWCAANEQVRNLSDLIRRRLPDGWNADLGLGVAEEAAALYQNHLGWSAAEAARQVAQYQRDVIENYAPSHQSIGG
ncbi:FAD-dependent oxidoreductase [soil metagenome]